MNRKLLEIACFSVESALIAQSSGADRVELCEDYSAGGITPPEEWIIQARKQLYIPLHVMIRPRAGDFVYSLQEAEQMKKSIEFCKSAGANGVVFGALTNNHKIDKTLCSELVALSQPMPVTFHRAVDECHDMKQALRELCNLGISRVLSSGHAATALTGLPELSILQKLFGKQIGIIAGGGVRAHNILTLLQSGCQEYHSAALGMANLPDAEEIRAMRRILDQVV